MRGQKRILMIAILLVSGSVFATVTEVSGVPSDESAWQTVSRTVKETVKKWFGWGTAEQMPAEPTYSQLADPARTKPVTPDKETISHTPPVPPVEPFKPSPEVEELRAQPLFSEKSEGSSLKDLQSARATLNAKHVLNVKKPGRVGSSQLPRTKIGVPVTDFKKIRQSRKVPRLDIGRETLVSKEDYGLPSFNWTIQKANDLKPLPKIPVMSPGEFNKVAGVKFTPAVKGVRGLAGNFRQMGKPVTLETVQNVKFQTAEVVPQSLKPYKPLSDEEIKMVSALILFERGDQCHMIMGLFNQLSKADKTRIEATYHLGACADSLGMHEAAFDQLATVIRSEDKEFAPLALELLAKDLPPIYEKDFYRLLKYLKNFKAMVTEKSSAEVFYRYAKGANKSGDFKTALTMAGMVSNKYTDEATFLTAISYQALKDKKNALRKLQELWDSLEARSVSESNIRAVTATNLARMYFANKQYDKALDFYMKVPKDHALWVQALIEQGWTQLALNDSAGAIGNMYSLHSPYFKAVFQPESFVVRTIGYLNICQYGDAYRTLSVLEEDYRKWYNSTSNYLISLKDPGHIYQTVKTYLKGKSSESVEGVPPQVLREMARHKEFLNLQTAINDKQDESARYEGVNEKIKREKATIRFNAEQAKKRFDQVRAQIAAAAKNKELMKNLNELNTNLRREKELTIGYRYRLALLEISRQGYIAFQTTAQNKLVVVQNELISDASKVLNRRVLAMQGDMAKVLENNELLRYEVFSGSGENIRFQVAGGAVDGRNNRIPATIKPTKMMNWSFDGEFWEDEIGSYRSALHNNCPQAGTQQALVDKEESE